MTQAHIHIGLHKTGSTYLQKVFTDNRAVLQDLGVDYPVLGAEHLFGHHNVAWSFIPGKALIGDFSLNEFSSYLEQSQAKHLLISSEDFEFLPPLQVLALRRLLERAGFAFEPKIVMYVREPLGALYSRWQEAVKHGSTAAISEYCRQLAVNSDPLDYGKIADVWTNAFGQESVSIVSYDNLVAEGQDLAVYFLREVLQVPVEPAQLSLPAERINPAHPIGVIELLRQLNQIHQTSGAEGLVTGRLMKFLRQQPKGQSLNHHLQTHYGERHNAEMLGRDSPKDLPDLKNSSDRDSEFIDLSELNQRFTQILETFLRSHKERIINLRAEEDLFVRSKDIKTPSIDSEVLAQQVDVNGLYRILMLDKA